MKKALALLSLVWGLAGTAHAQSIRIGVKAGASLTRLTDDNYSSSYALDFNGGVLANLAFTNHFSVQPEVLYAGKGRQEQPLYYLDVPVLAKVATGRTGVFLELGPQVGLLLAARSTNITGSSVDTKSFYNTFDFGYVGGLGFQIASGALVGLRYNGGLTNVYKPSPNYNGYGPSVIQSTDKNSALQLYVGYLFGGK